MSMHGDNDGATVRAGRLGKLRATAAVAIVTVVGFPGCAKYGQLKAMKAFKAANQAYAQQDYKKASTLYEEVLQEDPGDPQVYAAYFYLGNSYDNQFKPSKKGEADNDAFLNK